MPLYEPQEDSELLKKAVLHSAFGEVLDMGTGSGIQAFAAAGKEEVTSVLAVDIDDEAVAHVKRVISRRAGNAQRAGGREGEQRSEAPRGVTKILRKIEVRTSDLFAKIEGSFDTIIFNPPYLPQEPADEHPALYGGEHGYELTLRFLREAKKHLKPGGIILLLFSSLTNKELLLRAMQREGYHYCELAMEAHFFERLYVYKLWRTPHDEYFAKGKRGEVYLRETEKGRVLVKRRNPASIVDTLANEAYYTQLLNSAGIGPRFYSYEHGELVREFIDGEELRTWLPGATPAAVMHVLLTVLKQCRRMDQLGITKEEMTRPWKHIIVAEEPVLIDFERCKEQKVPKNVTQFCQFLTNRKLAEHLAAKGIHIKTERLLRLAQAYKHALKKGLLADDAFAKLFAFVQQALSNTIKNG